MSADTRIVSRPASLQGAPLGIPGLVLDSENPANSNPPRLINDGQELQIRAQRADLDTPLASAETAQLQVMIRARLAISTNVAALAGLSTIQLVALADGDIVLLWGQTDETQNGPYVVHANRAGVVQNWTRPALPFGHGSQAYILAGAYAGRLLQNTNAAKINYGVTAITFGLQPASAGSAIGSGVVSLVTTDSPYAVGPTDAVFLCDLTLAGSLQIFLPAAGGAYLGQSLTFLDSKRQFATGHTLSLVGNGNTINGQVSMSISEVDGGVTIHWTGTGWEANLAVGVRPASLVGATIAPTNFIRMLTSLGRNGAGAVTLTGAKVGDYIMGVVNVTDHVSLIPGTDFTSQVATANTAGQLSATDLSAKTLIFMLSAIG